MPHSLYFCDSNIWLYRLLVDPGVNNSEEVRKHDIATHLTNTENILISTQVINEVCAILLRKAKVTENQIRKTIQEFYEGCIVIEIHYDTIITASDLRMNYSLSYWDSIVVASALFSGADILYSEDMQDGLIIAEQLTIINPLKLSTNLG